MSRRIVSLVPSLSETLVVLGLRDELVGCTQFCVEPPDLHRTATVVGGTKDFDLDAIRKLNPTHILANQEENPRELIEVIREEYPLLLTFPKSPFDVPRMLRDMGTFLTCESVFSPLAQTLEELFQKERRPASGQKFLYFIWREPYMVAGRDTYISRFLEAFGWVNAYSGADRYPQLSLDDLRGIGVDTLLFSTEPYPFRLRDAQRLRKEWPECPPILKIDGRLMSWYGSATEEAWLMLAQELDSFVGEDNANKKAALRGEPPLVSRISSL